MPALDQKIIDDLTARVNRLLEKKVGYSDPKFIDSGGSAAIFSVETSNGKRALKAFNPSFLEGPGGAAERRRLLLQRKLIGHTCPSLVQTFGVEEAEGTAFVEMEFIQWPSLKKVLKNVPDESVVPLFTQLVAATQYLDSLNIIHRDIKPENIHVREDFSALKLLDLGVVRQTEDNDPEDAAATDHAGRRPFLATAQYSSPEYLFRLDEPSPKLWRGLNIYQLGAVLYDLINKEPLFQSEIAAENRWLVARAVLTRSPSFVDENPSRLLDLKALALRCLTKDIEARLQLVSWEDFILEGGKNPLTTLRARLAKGKPNIGGQMGEVIESRLAFERSEFFRRLLEMVRNELLHVCGTQIPLTLHFSSPGSPSTARLAFALNPSWKIQSEVSFSWLGQLYEKTANVHLLSVLTATGSDIPQAPKTELVSQISISLNEEENSASIAARIARTIEIALNLLENPGAEKEHLNGRNLLS